MVKNGDDGFEIYNAKFDAEIDTVILNVEKENIKYNKPNDVELQEIVKIVTAFIAKKGLKLYGGHALNYFMPMNNKIYKDSVGINDYDLYCVNAEEVGKELADILYEKGVDYVTLGVGAFGENYKLYCSFEEIANFTGLKKELFDIIPVETDKKTGIMYVAPDYLKMDLRVSLVNPRISLWRWIKDYERAQLLEKYYPFKKPKACKTMNGFDNKDVKMMDDLWKFVSNTGDIVYTGFMAMNAYFNAVGGKKNENVIGKNVIGKNVIEIMTRGIKEIVDKIVKKFGNKDFVYRVEEDPLHILPKKFVISSASSNKPLMVVYSLDEVCVPYNDINGMRYVSIDYLILYFQVMMYHVMIKMKNDRNGENNEINLYRCSIYGMDELRKIYLKKSGENIFDETIFKKHITKCFGNFVNPYYVTKILKWEGKFQGKTYIPALQNNKA